MNEPCILERLPKLEERGGERRQLLLPLARVDRPPRDRHGFPRLESSEKPPSLRDAAVEKNLDGDR